MQEQLHINCVKGKYTLFNSSIWQQTTAFYVIPRFIISHHIYQWLPRSMKRERRNSLCSENRSRNACRKHLYSLDTRSS